MSSIKVRQLRSINELLAAAEPWDDLWRRSELRNPIMQCDLLAQWLETFARDTPLHILVAEQDGRMLAALPLMGTKVHRVLPAAGLPGNPWVMAGDMTIDTGASAPAALDALVAQFSELPWPLIWLDPVDGTASRWQQFQQALVRAGMKHFVQTRFDIGLVEIGPSWEAYQRTWSGNHRRHMKRCLGRAQRDGTLELERYSNPDAAAIEPLMRQGFEVEDRSWKGREGTSALRSPGIFDFYLEQARLLSSHGQLELVFLMHKEKPIAFEYGWQAKGTYFRAKIGYDEAFHRFAPGQLLFQQLLEQIFRTQSHHLIDFFGPMSGASAQWVTSVYSIQRIIVAPNRLSSRLLLGAYRGLALARRAIPRRRPKAADTEAADAEASRSVAGDAEE